MKIVSLLLGSLLALTAAFFVGRFYGRLNAEKHVATPHDPQTGDLIARHRALVVLIDGHDVFCGNEKAPEAAVEEYVRQTMNLNKVDRVVLAASDITRHGDAVVLLGKLTNNGIRVSVSSLPTPPGTRLPLFERGWYFEEITR